ncbi:MULTISPECIES: suppressor of fused domain protein [Gimesia]|uniref:Suppressor of fused domain protein n=1 Tax=Gimesia benthica TaxID=2608982 RepID=A0A6I6AE02_9PLAN|nr:MULTISPECIES: suppressor of fused domain protein [Gimesia]KAA0134537.1 suppressor of fused domain protein [Gimesia chilikensis]QGQ24557.1 suppressor of fused domain protein [Gimesia benthica]
MDTFETNWLKALEERFGEIDGIVEVQANDDQPEIKVIYFENLPEEGTLTAVTCGLSQASHPDWEEGSKPELIVSLDTKDQSWGFAAGFFASAFFNEKRFSYGDIFQIDDPISEESEMSAYLVFAPSFLSQEEATFELPDRTIHLQGLYPLFESEIDLYDEIGLEKFWHLDGFDLYDVKRKPATA